MGKQLSLTGPLYKTCILPSTIIKMISQSDQQFRMRLAPSKREVQEFWETFLSTPEGQAYREVHPVLSRKTTQELATLVPIRLHEDSGPYSKTHGVNIISWSSLFGQGSEKETKF